MKNIIPKNRYQEEKNFLDAFFTNEKEILSFEDLEHFKSLKGTLCDYQIEYLIKEKGMIKNFTRKKEVNIEDITLSGGLSSHGYDITLGKSLELKEGFHLKHSFEYFDIPPFIVAKVYNKSTLCRVNITQPSSVLEANWKGHLTLEINIGKNTEKPILAEEFLKGTPIAHILFEKVSIPDNIYNGKYQNQGNYPVQAK